jgi:hypothetical protein
MKAQVSELYNVMLGCILIGIAFILFVLITYQMGNIQQQEVSDIQRIDTASSYLGVLAIINASQYENILHVSERINAEQKTTFFTGDIKKFSSEEKLQEEQKIDVNSARSMQRERVAYVYSTRSNTGFELITPIYILNKPLEINCTSSSQRILEQAYGQAQATNQGRFCDNVLRYRRIFNE